MSRDVLNKLPKGKYVICTLWKNAGITIAKNMLARSVIRITKCVTLSSLFLGGWGYGGLRGEVSYVALKSSVSLFCRPVFPLIPSAHPRRSKFFNQR